MIDAPEATKEKKRTGMDAIAALEQKASASSQAEKKAAVEEEAIKEIKAFEYTEQDVVLPVGWRMAEWKQKTLMNIHEDGALVKAMANGYENRWRRNYEVVKSVLENGGFNVKGVSVDDLDDMDWRDVEMIFLGVVAHYQNTILIKKK